MRRLAALVAIAMPPLAAQVPATVADAILRLDGPRDDVDALVFLIDGGAPAADAIGRELLETVDSRRSPKRARLLRVLRAMRPAPAAQCDALVELTARALAAQRAEVGPGPHPQSLALGDTLVTVAARAHRQGSRAGEDLAAGGTAFARNLAAALAAIDAVRAATVGGRAIRADELRGFPAELATPADRALLDGFVELLERTTGAVHDEAALAIARIDPEHPRAVEGLGRLVRRADDPRDRVQAAVALGHHGARAASQVTALIAVLHEDVDDRLTAEAVTALGTIGAPSYGTRVALQLLRDDERLEIARRAAAALAALERR